MFNYSMSWINMLSHKRMKTFLYSIVYIQIRPIC